MSLFSLANKAALVTGASSGLGRHFAGVLAGAGATVVVAARRVDKLQEVAAEIEAKGGRALAVEMDVTSDASVAAAFATIGKALGRPCDVVINNSGMSREGWYREQSEEDWNAVIDTNLTGVWRVGNDHFESGREEGGRHPAGALRGDSGERCGLWPGRGRDRAGLVRAGRDRLSRPRGYRA